MGIQFEKVNFKYAEGSTYENAALIDINLDIELGEFLAVIGHTGSGKSTLIQHMNALLQPTTGTVKILDKKVIAGKKNQGINSIRKTVGLVFQFPEYQLFEETVEKDIMFGPMNFGASKEEASEMAHKVIKLVGLDEDILSRSPLNLSGGQMRRVAIAGILAMEPQVLILDEPTAGLDPQGQKEMMEVFNNLYEKYNKTIILITHDMNHVAKYAKRVVVMDHGKIVYDGLPKELFLEKPLLKKCQLDLPDLSKLVVEIEDKLNIKLDNEIKSVEDLSADIIMKIGGEQVAK